MNLTIDIRCLQDSWRTGVGEYAWKIIQNLKKQSVNLNITGYGNAFKKVNFPDGLENYLHLLLSRLPNKIRNLQYYFKVGPTLTAELLKKNVPTDVLWVPNPMFVNLDNKIPTVLTVHDLSFVYWPHFFKRRGHLWYFPAAKNLIKSSAQKNIHLACVSKYTADEVLRFVPEYKKKIEIVYPAVEPEFFNKPTSANNVIDKLSISRPYVLSIGTLEPRKNHALIIKAYEEILKTDPTWPYDLVLAGAWGWRTENLKKALSISPHKNRIHVTGYIAEADKLPLIAGASLFLYPSFYEGFGMPVLEAMAAGVPVIVSASSSLPEVVGPDGLLVTPYDYRIWVSVIKQVMSDNNLRNNLIKAGISQATKFSWQKSAQAYTDLFKNLCA